MNKNTLNESVTIDDTIKFLNDLLAIDPDAIGKLVETRVGCNAALAGHPTVQVSGDLSGQDCVGLLGVLNGLFGVDFKFRGPITAEFDDVSGKLTRFYRTK